MSPLGLARFNTAAILVATGLVVGHWLQPVPGVVVWGRTLLFLALIALIGALRGWREAALRQPPAGRTLRLALIVAFAIGAVLLVGVGYVAFHGPPA